MEYVYHLYSSSSEGFAADRDWIEQIRREGIACSLCAFIYQDQLRRFSQLVVSNRKAPAIHKGSVSWMARGVVLSHRLIDVLGKSLVQEAADLFPIVNKMGKNMESHVFLVPAPVQGIVRGPGGPPPPGICAICGRLRYWPGPEYSDRYLLRRYWTEGAKFKFMAGQLIVDASFYEKEVKPLKLGKLVAYKLPLIDEPRDGLPADYTELVNCLRERWIPGCNPSPPGISS
jgi:hypothetical protein